MRFAAKQRVHAIAIVPSVTNRDPRVIDLIGFGKLLRGWAKKSPVRKKSRAAGKNLRLAPQPARRVV